MQLVLTENDLAKLTPSTRAELLGNLFPSSQLKQPEGTENFRWDGVVSLTPNQMRDFMLGCAEITKAGLRVIAERGPLIHASALGQAGITNYNTFQGAITKRTRTITGEKGACLLAYDDWKTAENKVGHFAVNEETFNALRIFFNLI